MQIDFPPEHVKGVPSRPCWIESGDGALMRRIGEKVDMQPPLVCDCGEERIAADGLEQLLLCPQNHGNSIAEAFFDTRPDGLGYFGRSSLRVEDYIAALDVSANIVTTRGREYLREILHWQDVFASDIDAAQKRQISHVLYIMPRGRTLFPVGTTPHLKSTV